MAYCQTEGHKFLRKKFLSYLCLMLFPAKPLVEIIFLIFLFEWSIMFSAEVIPPLFLREVGDQISHNLG